MTHADLAVALVACLLLVFWPAILVAYVLVIIGAGTARPRRPLASGWRGVR